MQYPLPAHGEGQSPFANIDPVSRAVLACAGATTNIPDQPFLLADRVLSSTDPDSRLPLLTIAELAQIQPKGSLVAAHINRIHQAHGVDAHISPRIAEAHQVLLAGAALDTIRREAKVAAAIRGIAVPAVLNKEITMTGLGLFKRERIQFGGAVALQEFLTTADPDVLQDVKAVVAWDAQQARNRASQERQDTLQSYRDRGPNKQARGVAQIQEKFRIIARQQERRLRQRLSGISPI